MGAKTGIEWTDASVNFWGGCHMVSSGCANCYMFADQKRYGGDPNTVKRYSDKTFYAALNWKEPKKIFTCSWSDFFIEEADAWRTDAWDVIRRTPHHTWQILTKRPERIAQHLPPDWGDGWANVWLGTSVENQKAADERIDQILRVPAWVHFLSCEPMLSSLNLRQSDTKVSRNWLEYNQWVMDGKFSPATYNRIDWVICGGESGSQARLFEVGWARHLKAQCEAAKVPFFLKQMGSVVGAEGEDSREWGKEAQWNYKHNTYLLPLSKKGGDWDEWPADLRVRQFPKIALPEVPS